jgi:hypothetical protein
VPQAVRWEYRWFPTIYVERSQGSIDSWLKVLNDLGRDGWEAVGTVATSLGVPSGSSLAGHLDTHRGVLLKRPLRE